MSRITSKLQVTLPKALATHCGIKPGTEVEWAVVGNGLRLLLPAERPKPDTPERLRLFDAATARLRRKKAPRGVAESGRGWTREELYERDRPR